MQSPAFNAYVSSVHYFLWRRLITEKLNPGKQWAGKDVLWNEITVREGVFFFLDVDLLNPEPLCLIAKFFCSIIM